MHIARVHGSTDRPDGADEGDVLVLREARDATRSGVDARADAEIRPVHVAGRFTAPVRRAPIRDMTGAQIGEVGTHRPQDQIDAGVHQVELMRDPVAGTDGVGIRHRDPGVGPLAPEQGAGPARRRPAGGADAPRGQLHRLDAPRRTCEPWCRARVQRDHDHRAQVVLTRSAGVPTARSTEARHRPNSASSSCAGPPPDPPHGTSPASPATEPGPRAPEHLEEESSSSSCRTRRVRPASRPITGVHLVAAARVFGDRMPPVAATNAHRRSARTRPPSGPRSRSSPPSSRPLRQHDEVELPAPATRLAGSPDAVRRSGTRRDATGRARERRGRVDGEHPLRAFDEGLGQGSGRAPCLEQRAIAPTRSAARSTALFAHLVPPRVEPPWIVVSRVHVVEVVLADGSRPAADLGSVRRRRGGLGRRGEEHLDIPVEVRPHPLVQQGFVARGGRQRNAAE